MYFEVNLKVIKLTWPILRVSFQRRETLYKNPFDDTFSDFVINGKSHARIKQIKKKNMLNVVVWKETAHAQCEKRQVSISKPGARSELKFR